VKKDKLESLREQMPNFGTDNDYLRWLVNAVYSILCYLIEKDA